MFNRTQLNQVRCFLAKPHLIKTRPPGTSDLLLFSDGYGIVLSGSVGEARPRARPQIARVQPRECRGSRRKDQMRHRWLVVNCELARRTGSPALRLGQQRGGQTDHSAVRSPTRWFSSQRGGALRATVRHGGAKVTEQRSCMMASVI